MRRFARISTRLQQAAQALDKRPPFADPMAASVAMFAYQERGELPRDKRQAEFLRRWAATLQAMDSSIPKCEGGDNR